jgi:hypothetical protein
MLRVGLLFCLLAGWAHAQDFAASDKDLTKKIDAVIRQWQTLKRGMTRADLEKILQTEGGLSSIQERLYVWRSCPYIKVDVQFNPTSPGQKDELPTDTVTSYSKPFLQYSNSD